eukprot:m.119437 g.119437  ORF g.119437 m.119437 type:complete len:356 (+) comp52054_c0_seq7:93-1160(+)
MTTPVTIIEHSNKSLNYTIFGAKWIPASARMVAFGSHARGTAALQVYQLAHGKLELLVEVEKPSAIKCGTFGASSLSTRHFATGDFAGHLMVWDLERLDLPVFDAKAHGEIINCIDGCGGLNIGNGAPELVTASRDGSVKIWDIRQQDPVVDISPSEGEHKRDCWAVAFGNSFDDDSRSVVAGYDNGDIKMFDLRTLSLQWETHLPNGICSLQFDRKDINMNKLLVTSLESKFHVYDLRTYNQKSGFTHLTESAHKSTIWCGAHLPQNRDVFMTCGGNGSLSLWKYQYPSSRVAKDADNQDVGVVGTVSLVNNVALATQPISSIDWNMDKAGLFVTAAFDQALRVGFVTNVNTLK